MNPFAQANNLQVRQSFQAAFLQALLAPGLMISTEAIAASKQAEVMMNKPGWLLAVVLGVGLLLGGRWVLAARADDARQAQAKAAEAKAREHLAAARTEQGRREYVLEVINLGVTFDKYRQRKLWEALQSGNPYTSLREKDPRKYPWTSTDKRGLSGGRALDALLNGAGYSVTDWGTPVFNAMPPDRGEDPDSPLSPDMGLALGAEGEGMSDSLFVAGPRRFDERPDRILDEVSTSSMPTLTFLISY